MKSRHSDGPRAHAVRVLVGIGFGVAFAAASPATAEITPRPELRKTKPTAVETMARVPEEGPRTVLRCWQEGRLVFEGVNLQMAAPAESGGTSAALRGPDGRSVQLMDLRQGLCVYERNRP